MKVVIKKRGQIWVETVIYTLIGLAIIGLVMAAALPKIEKWKDEIAIEQAIESLRNIDNKIYEVIVRGSGNRRVDDLEIKKGVFIIDMDKEIISWILDSSFQYSEKDVPVSIGRIDVTTTAKGDSWDIELKRKYSGDIQYNEANSGTKQLDVAPTPYRLIIENKGKNSDGNTIIGLVEF